MEGPAPIPITVIGGYLGAGKTTLVNRLLAETSGRRIGVVVNDFGELGVDARLLRAATEGVGGGDVPVVNLANGCVCCTLGDDLRETVETLRSVEPRLDHIVIEASGVADPATAAAWGTVPGFAPGGVIVLAAADSVVRSAGDRYVGPEVLRQLAGADLVLVTKTDIVNEGQLADVLRWLGSVSDAPVRVAPHGAIDPDVVLGPIGTRVTPSAGDLGGSHDDRYRRWATHTGTTTDAGLREFLARLPDGVLRAKGEVAVAEECGTVAGRRVNVVGRTVLVTSCPVPLDGGVEAIGIDVDPTSLQLLADEYLCER